MITDKMQRRHIHLFSYSSPDVITQMLARLMSHVDEVGLGLMLEQALCEQESHQLFPVQEAGYTCRSQTWDRAAGLWSLLLLSH